MTNVLYDCHRYLLEFERNNLKMVIRITILVIFLNFNLVRISKRIDHNDLKF